MQAFNPGDKVLIRSVTYFSVGKVREVTEDGFIILDNASWVADTGRLGEALKTGRLSEVETSGPEQVMFVAKAAIVDAFPFDFDLPTVTK